MVVFGLPPTFGPAVDFFLGLRGLVRIQVLCYYVSTRELPSGLMGVRGTSFFLGRFTSYRLVYDVGGN